MREGRTEVLVVGAGPVGLWTALLLAEAGVQVTIIDRESRTAARSYACALHPRTLKLLHRFGLVPKLLERGRRIETLAFYSRGERHAQISLPAAESEFPYLLIIPQNAFEDELEQRLRQAGVVVHWNHRFDAFSEEEGRVITTVEELAGTSTGYVVPHWETVVKRRAPVSAQFLIGADGHNSLVRQRLGIGWQKMGERQVFAAYEFESNPAALDEVRIVLEEATTNVLWPLPNQRLRWTFQLTRAEGPPELPQKERRAVRLEQPEIDEELRQRVQRVAAQRAPWFTAAVRKIEWCSEVAFEPRLVSSFGRGRCWLAGDAAHQAGPVGVQSMNCGFWESFKLTGLISRILREETTLEPLDAYDREQHSIWRQLLNAPSGLRVRADTDPWVRDHAGRLLSCLPGMGESLARLAQQLQLDAAADAPFPSLAAANQQLH